MKRVLMLGILLVGGCRTMESVKKDTDGGTTKEYAGSVEEVVGRAQGVFKAAGAEKVEREGDAVFASFPANGAHDGTFCGAWVMPAGEGKVSVRCVTKNRSAHIIACAMTEREFHDLLSRK